MSQTSTVGKHQTQVYAQGMKMVIRYHSTNVVEFDNNQIILNNDGWFTKTTKLRMNQAATEYRLDFHVWQKDNEWYVELKNGKKIPYHNGMVINRNPINA